MKEVRCLRCGEVGGVTTRGLMMCMACGLMWLREGSSPKGWSEMEYRLSPSGDGWKAVPEGTLGVFGEVE